MLDKLKEDDTMLLMTMMIELNAFQIAPLQIDRMVIGPLSKSEKIDFTGSCRLPE